MQFTSMKEEIKYLNLRYQLNQKLEALVHAHGFIKVEPDYFEPYERFVDMNKRINKESLVKLMNNDGSISVLRPDVTANIIKQVIPKIDENESLKMFYLATTFSQKIGQQIEETKQFGVEYLGNANKADIEIINLIMLIVNSFKQKFLLEIGHQKFLDALLKNLELFDDKISILKGIIFNKNRGELAIFIKENVKENSYTQLLQHIFDLQGSINDLSEKLKPFKLDKEMKQAIDELILLDQSFDDQVKKQSITYDLSLISKYDYYDGMTFKGYLKNVPTPILSGGRYDQMTKQFGKMIPATGFSINLTELIKEVFAA